MLYIFCEDQAAGHKFWRVLGSELLGLLDENIVPCAGVTNIATVMNNTALCSDDIVIVPIDHTGQAQYATAIKAIRKDSRSRGFRVIFTAYYCFEAFLLSFKEVHIWGRCKDSKVLSIYDDVHKKMWAESDWFEGLDAEYKRIWSLHYPERLANRLLDHVTKESGESFHAHKSFLGDCWVSDCKERTYCADCLMNQNLTTTKRKLEYVLHNAVPLLDGADINEFVHNIY